jgi:hypothetical protein
VGAGDEFEVTLDLAASGAMQGFSARLGWDTGVAQYLGSASAGFLEGQGGVLFPAGHGTVDGALLGVGAAGIRGQGTVAAFRFRALRDGDPRIQLASLRARDAANQPIGPEAVSRSMAASAPARTLMLSPAPNPATAATTLSFALARAGDAELALYSVDGRRVRTLAQGRRDAGAHHITWRGEDDAGRALGPGIYWAKLRTGGLTFTRRIVFLR